MKIAVYTANIGSYDNFKDPPYVDVDIDYYLFTDVWVRTNVYTLITVKPHNTADLIKVAREIKIMAHKFLSQYDFTIWHDANISQQTSLHPLIKQMNCDFAVMKHPERNCIYAELTACIEQKKDDYSIMTKQVAQYKTDGLPQNEGMVATGVILRKNTKEVRLFCEAWNSEVKKGSCRDQLSFNYVRWKQKKKIQMFPFSKLLSSVFTRKKHN